MVSPNAIMAKTEMLVKSVLCHENQKQRMKNTGNGAQQHENAREHEVKRNRREIFARNRQDHSLQLRAVGASQLFFTICVRELVRILLMMSLGK